MSLSLVLPLSIGTEPENKLHIFLRIDSGCLGRLDQGIEEAGGVNSVYGLAEQPVLPIMFYSA